MSNELTLPEQLAAVSEEIARQNTANLENIADTNGKVNAINQLINTLNSNVADLEQLKTDVHSAMNRHYTVNHDVHLSESLEDCYDGIVSENPELANASAVGFMAMLKTGDELNASGNLLFINGKAEPSYSISMENAVEFVNVWYFANGDSSIVLPQTSINIIEVNIMRKNTEIELPNGYYNSVKKLTTDGYTDFDIYYNTDEIIAKNIVDGDGVLNFWKSIAVKSMTIDLIELKRGFAANNSSGVLEFPPISKDAENKQKKMFVALHLLETLIFPNLTTIEKYGGLYGKNNSPLYKCEQATIYMPEIVTIGASLDDVSGFKTGIYGCKGVVVGDKCKNIGAYSFDAVRNIILYCNEANEPVSGNTDVGIVDNWCVTAPSESFVMADDWACSINIATASLKYVNDRSWYMNLIQNKLRTMTSETVRTLKVPSAVFTYLNTTACTIEGYTDSTWIQYANSVKHWTITA